MNRKVSKLFAIVCMSLGLSANVGDCRAFAVDQNTNSSQSDIRGHIDNIKKTASKYYYRNEIIIDKKGNVYAQLLNWGVFLDSYGKFQIGKNYTITDADKSNLTNRLKKDVTEYLNNRFRMGSRLFFGYTVLQNAYKSSLELQQMGRFDEAINTVVNEIATELLGVATKKIEETKKGKKSKK